MPTTPSGTRTWRSSRPFGRREPRTTSPTGSGRSATWRSAGRDVGDPVRVSVSRSTRPAAVPSASARATSSLVGLQDLRCRLVERVGHGQQRRVLDPARQRRRARPRRSRARRRGRRTASRSAAATLVASRSRPSAALMPSRVASDRPRSAGSSRTRSSRCTTSRSYAGPSSRARSRVDRPSSAGSSAASKLTSPRATARPVASSRSTGSPATKSPSTPVMPAGSSDSRRSTTARDRPGVQVQPAARRSAACASHSSRVRRRGSRSGGSRCRPSSPASAAPASVGRGDQTTGMPATVASAGRLDLGRHAAAADPGRPRRRAGPGRRRPGRPRRGPRETSAAARPARVAVVQPVDVGEQHQQVGPHQVRDQRGQPVVVAEPDLVGGDGVVLVDHRDGAEPRAAGPACAARCGSARGGPGRRR